MLFILKSANDTEVYKINIVKFPTPWFIPFPVEGHY